MDMRDLVCEIFKVQVLRCEKNICLNTHGNDTLATHIRSLVFMLVGSQFDKIHDK